MVRIAPVNLNFNPKTLWFDAGELDVHAGDGVVVSTARGTEFGRASDNVFEADEAQVKKLKTPLKPVERIATKDDEERAAAMGRKSAEALPVFKEMAAEANDDMHPVSVEYLFDGDKAIFYFEAEERVDFRDLVRKLAARFHIRIDMRQIGVRDEARMVGGLGHCGQELCCKRLGGEFCPVSIRMAKEQDLSLNPQKISGLCGRLMCCLRYEFDAYKDFKTRAPKQGSQVQTPVGPAKVVDLDVPREVVSLKVEGEKSVRVPLADFDTPEEGTRPKSVSEQVWEQASTRAAFGVVGESASLITTQLTGQDKLADPKVVRRMGHGKQKAHSGSVSGDQLASRAADKQEVAESIGRKPRRRRSTKVGSDPSSEQGTDAQMHQKNGRVSQKKQGQKQRGAQGDKKQQSARSADRPQKQKDGQEAAKQGPRPGQRSSALRQGQDQPHTRQDSAPRPEGGARQDAVRPDEGGHRRARRRSHKAKGAGDRDDSAGTAGGSSVPTDS